MSFSAASEAKIDQLGERVREGRRDNNYFYERMFDSQNACKAEVGGEAMLLLSSYSYLGLIGDVRIATRSHSALTKFGSGTHGVRLLAGTLDCHLELERALASFKGADDAVTFSSGYAANIAAVTTVLGHHGTAVCDKLVHASIVDAYRQSGCKVRRFKHNDVEDLARNLEQAGAGLKMVIVDGLYSMDGDVANLPSIVEVARAHDALVMVDEAHSLGVIGASGHGIEEHFGLPNDAVDIKMGTLSKAIPATGGYLTGRADLIDGIRHNARPYIFSGALAPPTAAAAVAALEIIVAEPGRVERLHENTLWLHHKLRGLGFDLGDSSTAVIPVMTGTEQQAFDMTRYCGAAGVFVSPVVFPAVAKSKPRLRLAANAAHEIDDLERAVEVLLAAGQAAGVLHQSAA